MVTAPTKNPACPPRLTPVRMVNAVTGLHWGAQKKAPRPATPSPHRQASSTSSRAPGRRRSNQKKLGSRPSSRSSRLIQ